jgi:hypothetical protein
MDIPANPFGAFLRVDPNMTNRKIAVRAISAMKQATREYPCGE